MNEQLEKKKFYLNSDKWIMNEQFDKEKFHLNYDNQ